MINPNLRLSSRSAFLVLTVGFLLGLPLGRAEEAADLRDETIRATRESLEQTIQDHGGSFEAWAESLAPFRQALQAADFRRARDGWSFRPADRNLLLLDHLDERPSGRCPFEAMVHLDRQLKARGIDLIVVPIPDKTAIYPDYVVGDAAPTDRIVSVAAMRLLLRLTEADVEVIDLYTPFHRHRHVDRNPAPLYYGQGDTHWRNLGMRLASERIAERLMRYPAVRDAQARGNLYKGQPFRREDGFKADDVLLVRTRDGADYGDDPRSPFLLTGDSYAFYNSHLRSHFTAQVALHAGLPLDLLFREGLWGNMPVELARRGQAGGYLGHRKAVIYTFIARSLTESAWPRVDLPEPRP